MEFKAVYVFDNSQTYGELLPSVPDWKCPERTDELNQKLIEFARTDGISVKIHKLEGKYQGCFQCLRRIIREPINYNIQYEVIRSLVATV